MSRLIHFLIAQFANGAVMGLGLAELLLWFDFCDLGSLMHASPDSAALSVLFFAQAAVLFGTLGMSVAVMNLSDDDG